MLTIEEQKKLFGLRFEEAIKLQDQEKYQEAEELLDQLASDQIEVLGDNDLATLQTIHELGVIAYRLERYEESETKLRQALQGRQETLGKQHERTIESTFYLAVALRFQLKYAEAEPLVRQCVASRQHLGSGNIDALLLVYQRFLAYVLRQQGKFPDADEAYRRTVEAYEQLLGKDSAETVSAKEALQEMRLEWQEHKKKMAQFYETLQDHERLLSTNKDTLLEEYQEVIKAYKEQKYSHAKDLFRRILRRPLPKVSCEAVPEKPKPTTPQEEGLFSYKDDMDPWEPKANKIRLIELYKPSSGETTQFPLRCKIFWASVDDPAAFVSLSYVWGEGDNDHDIFIGDSLKKLKITKSLHEALTQIVALSTGSEVLWVDQVCINQADLDERNEQIANMTRVYQSAKETLVWLGPSSDNSDQVMDYWREVGQWAIDWNMNAFRHSPNLRDIIEHSDSEETAEKHRREYLDIVASRTTPSLLVAMRAWARRTWFTRVWVVQEFTLPDEVTFLCGTKKASVDQVMLGRLVWGNTSPWLVGAGLGVESSPRSYTDGIDTLTAIAPLKPFYNSRNRWRRDNGVPQPNLFEQLKALHIDVQMQATDARDRVFALLAIAADVGSTHRKGMQLEANYHDDVAVTYAKVAKTLIKHGDVDLLSLIQIEKDPRMPSWAPDWRFPIFLSVGSLLRVDYSPHFSASKGTRHIIFTEGLDDLELGLEGYKVDAIQEIGTPWFPDQFGEAPADLEWTARLLYIEEIQDFCERSKNLQGNSIYKCPQRQSEAVWRVPIGDIQSGELRGLTCQDTETADMASEEGYRQLTDEVKILTGKFSVATALAKVAKLRAGGPDPNRPRPQYIFGMNKMRYKAPFLSKTGYVGMAPWGTQPDDKIFVFAGHHMPYVIRPLEPGGDRYRLIGECYCDGIMYGELGIVENEMQPETIILV
ncbi:Heterokaryon incompatibility protein (HET) domain containing protein [Naviculisporaceae sp. PSN 640]